MSSRAFKSLILIFILAVSLAGVVLCLDGKIFAASQDDLNDEISDSIKEETGEEAGDVSEDIKVQDRAADELGTEL